MRPRIPNVLLAEQHNLDAVTRSIVYAGFLWWLTWPQLVVRFFYGLPYFGDPAFALGFYEHSTVFPLTLPELFLSLSVVAAIVSLVGAWDASRQSAGKWRQRLLVFFFAAVCCWVAYLPFRWEPIFLQNAYDQREFIMQNPMMNYPEDTPEEIRAQEWQHLDRAIEAAEKRMNR